MSSDELRLRLMLEDYNNARDDERYFVTVQTNILSIGLAALGAMFLLIKYIDEKVAIPAPLIASMPLIVLAFLAYSQFLGAQASLRSFYARALERELRESVLPPNNRSMKSYEGLKVMSAVELNVEYSSMSNPRSFASFMRSIIFGALLAVFGLLFVYLSLRVSLSWRILMWIFYGISTTVILVENYRTVVHGRTFFQRVVRASHARLGTDLVPSSGSKGPQRGLASYLVLPRPDDLATKSVFTILGVVLGSVTQLRTSVDVHPLEVLVIMIVAIEAFVYQARYQWNDIRGTHEDASSPTATERGRLPGGAETVNVSLCALLLRIALVGWATALIVEIDPRPRTVVYALIWSVVGVFGLATVYEAVRARVNRAGSSSLTLFALLTIVSCGYPLRFALGWIGAGASLRSGQFYIFCAGLAFLGVVFVAPTWILEAVSYVTYRSPPGVKPRRYLATPEILRKDHLRRLARWHGIVLETNSLDASEEFDGRNFRALRGIDVSGPAVWTVAGAGWISICGVLPSLITGSEVRWSALGTFCFLGVIGLSKFLPYGAVLPFVVGGFVVSVGTVIGMPDAIHHHSWALLGVSAVAPLVPALLIASFRNLSYTASRNFAANLVAGVRRLIEAAYLWFIGRGAGEPNRLT